MNIFISSIEVCLPLLFLVALGVLLRKLKMIGEITIKEVSKMILNLFLPINIFLNIYNGNLKDNFSLDFILILFSIYLVVVVVSLFSIFLITKDNRERSSMLQNAIRGNLTLFAAPLAGQLAGDEGTTLTAVCASIFAAVNTLYVVGEFEFFESKAPNIGKLLLNVIKSPVIIASIIGFIFAFLGIKLPTAIYTTCSYISRSVVAFSLVTIGASFNFAINKDKLKKVLFVVVFKTVMCPLIAICLSRFVKLNEMQIIAEMCLYSAPCATCCYAQACPYDTDIELTSSSLVYSYVACMITLPAIISLMRITGLIN